MAMKKGGLGKGLNALFEENATEDSQVITLPLSEIEPNRNQPRKSFDDNALAELAQSITQHGVLQPLLVRPIPGKNYQIVAGERRWRASRMAGLSEVPVVIREMSDQEAAEIALIENLQREDLNPMEEALGYQQLMEQYGLTQEEAAVKVNKSRPAVANALRLLKLPKEIAEMVQAGKLSAGHARALLAFSDAASQMEAAKEAESGKLSVRDLEKRAKAAEKQPNVSRETPSVFEQDTFYHEVQLSLSEHMDRKVKVMQKGKKGVLQMEFYDEDDLRTLAKLLAPED